MRRRAVLALVAGALGAGCVRPQVMLPEQGLPLTRVVLYRNGIGYFERGGEVASTRLRFRVLREHVEDFLATLAVVDSAGRAQSVSFPSVEEGEEGDDMVDVVVALEGGEAREVRVAYVVEAPIWRPTYRVVIGDGETSLQGWAIVQNASGEEWSAVHMSVTSGAPLSFRADLSRVVIPSRPMVTDSGEMVAAPVYSETTLDSGEEQAEPEVAAEAPPPPAQAEAERAVALEDALTGEGGGAGAASARSRAGAPRRARRAAPPIERPASPPGPGPTPEQAGAAVEALLSEMEPPPEGVRRGGNRYDVPGLVTVPDSGSTMVSILDARVPGEDALLYRPDPAVPHSDTYPMRVLRIRNETEVLLERGPIAIYEADALLGQGLLAALPAGATTTIPFAVERGVAVTVTRDRQRTPARLMKVAGGRVTVQEFDQQTTTYRIQNGTDRATKIYLRHARTAGWDFLSPPEGTEEVEGAALVPVALSPNRDASIDLVERTPVQTTVDFLSEPGQQAVGFYLEGAAIDAAAGPVLRTAMEQRDRLEEIRRNVQIRQAQRGELQGAAAEVRTNLAALEGNRRAVALRDRLAERLADLTRRIETLTNEIVELELERGELQVRLSETLRELTLEVPQ